MRHRHEGPNYGVDSRRRGLLVSIYRHPRADCTNGGVTCPARAPTSQAILLGIPGGNYVEGDLPEDLPVFEIERVLLRVGEPKYIRARPVGETRRTMAGGNFIYTSDSRFRQHVCEYPISVHDRVED